jgi:hypothetical protein
VPRRDASVLLLRVPYYVTRGLFAAGAADVGIRHLAGAAVAADELRRGFIY